MEGCRRAEAGDLSRIVALARQLREEIAPVRGATLWAVHEAHPEPLEDAYGALLDSDEACVLVGTIDDAVLGFAIGELDQLHDGRLLGVVSDLYVEPEAREVGIGEILVAELLGFFAGRDCVGVDAWALPGHRMTKNFFEEQGFVSRGIVVHRRLSPPEPS